MTALPASEANPEDPAVILRALPEENREQFLAQYREAVERALGPDCFPALRGLLHMWRLYAFATAQPGFAERMAQAREAARTGDWGESIPLEDVIAAYRQA